MRSETHLVRMAVLSGAIYLHEAEWIESDAERDARNELVARVTVLDEATRPQFEANVSMPEAGQMNRLWDAIGSEVVAMLRERQIKNHHDVQPRLNLAEAIDKARGV